MVPFVTDLFIETKQSQLFFVRFDLLQPFVQLGFARFDPALAMDRFPTNESDDENDGGSVCEDAKMMGAFSASVCACEIPLRKVRRRDMTHKSGVDQPPFRKTGYPLMRRTTEESDSAYHAA